MPFPLSNTPHHMLYPRNNLRSGGMSKILTLGEYFMRAKLVFQKKVFQSTFLLISPWKQQDTPLSLAISPWHTHTSYKPFCDFLCSTQPRSKAAKFQPPIPMKIKLSATKDPSWFPTGSRHEEKDAPLECFPEGLLGNDSSMECVDVWSTFSKLLLTLLMGVSDLGVTWKEKYKKSIKINGGNTQTSHLLCSEGSPGKAVRTSWLLLKLRVLFLIFPK